MFLTLEDKFLEKLTDKREEVAERTRKKRITLLLDTLNNLILFVKAC